MKHNTPAQEAKSLETLFFTFFKIGLFTFGGGYAISVTFYQFYQLF